MPIESEQSSLMLSWWLAAVQRSAYPPGHRGPQLYQEGTTTSHTTHFIRETDWWLKYEVLFLRDGGVARSTQLFWSKFTASKLWPYKQSIFWLAFFFSPQRCSEKQNMWEHNKNESYGSGGHPPTRGLTFRDKYSMRRLLKLHFHWPSPFSAE